MLEEIDRNAAEGRSFAFETTLSGHTYIKRIDAWREAGYTVRLFFLALANPNEAVARVAMRVQQGGHNVAEKIVRRRFAATGIGWISGNGSTTAVRHHAYWKRGRTRERRTAIAAR